MRENSLMVVEHDQEMIMSADYLVDLGPEPERERGRVIVLNSPEKIIAMTPEQIKECKSLSLNT